MNDNEYYEMFYDKNIELNNLEEVDEEIINTDLDNKIKKYGVRTKLKSKFNEDNIMNNSDDESLKIYTITWNMYGQYARKSEIQKLLPIDKFYHLYAIGTEECMRGILTSFFYNDKSGWENLAQYKLI
jgi:hypothetical protein